MTNGGRFILLSFCLLCGCDGALNSPGARSGLPSESPAIKIVDRLNRHVLFRAAPTRIISLSPETTELLFALDLGSKIVGTTEYCDYPPAAKALPRMGSGPLGTLSREAIIQACPDLVLCKFDAHQPLVQSLERLGIVVLALGPQSLSEMLEEAAWLGQITGHTTQAALLTQQMSERLRQLTSGPAMSNDDRRPTVFYQVWHDPLMTVGPGAFVDELLQMAKLRNIVARSATAYPRVSLELLIQEDPDYIIVPRSPSAVIDFDDIAQRPGWENLQAIQNRRVLFVDADRVSRCGPRMLDALEEIIQAVEENGSPPALPES